VLVAVVSNVVSFPAVGAVAVVVEVVVVEGRSLSDGLLVDHQGRRSVPTGHLLIRNSDHHSMLWTERITCYSRSGTIPKVSLPLLCCAVCSAVAVAVAVVVITSIPLLDSIGRC